MIFRQLFDSRSSTYSYLLADEGSKEAVLIDPVFEQVMRDSALLDELGLELRYTLDTHVHADHVTGAWLLREQLGSRIAMMKAGGAEGADLNLEEGDRVPFGERYLKALSTPGHTSGCGTYLLDDESMAFTGDCLLIRGCGRTDFQQGSAETMFHSIHDKIFALPGECLLYPAHDYQGRMATTVSEERAHNPRCGGALSLNDFVQYMETLGLPHPKQIDVALPANLQCGKPTDEKPMPGRPTWAPLRYTYAGVWEVSPEWLGAHLAEVQVVDVRPKEEVLRGPLGYIEGSIFLPLANLEEAASARRLDRDKPVVVVCRAGGRSAQASQRLKKVGFEKIASLTGGMLHWCDEGGETVGVSPA